MYNHRLIRFDQTVDIWSLGTVLYEMATMKKMFDEVHQGTLVEMVCSLDFDREILRTLNPLFQVIIINTVRINPEERWNAGDISRCIVSY